jgi:hypothetical protein
MDERIMSHFKFWGAVPYNSRLLLGVPQDDIVGNVSISADVIEYHATLPPQGVSTSYNHAQLVPGPVSIPIVQGHNYVIRPSAVFVGKGGAPFRAILRRDNGAPFSKGVEFAFAGTDARDAGTIIVRAKR